MTREALPVRNVGVVGAGTMGHGIAQVFAQAGFSVRLIDVAGPALDRALVGEFDGVGCPAAGHEPVLAPRPGTATRESRRRARAPLGDERHRDRLEELVDVTIPRGNLIEESREWELSIDSMARGDEDMSAYIAGLESARDEESAIPISGDALAREGIDAVNLHHSDWNGGLVSLFHRFDRIALGWDMQETHLIERALRMGLDGVFSDHPDRMVDAYRSQIGALPGTT